MKKLLTSLISITLFLVITPLAHAEDRWVKVTSPNGGETLQAGQSYTITWDSSPNIDKVAIGWSTGPGSLNWIAFSTPNTKSYTWNVNVGNTTNTQFQIEIIGYETGQGSTSDRSDGYFTIPSNAQPTATPQPTVAATPTTTKNNPRPTINLKPIPSLSPTPYQQRVQTFLSITSITLWQVFYFEGSETTDLSKIDDPKHVENFTLDTQIGYTFVFTEELDLTDQENLQALDNIEEYWIMETWFIWIKEEWWITYEIEEPIEITYENKELTAYAPKLEKQPEKETEKPVETAPVKKSEPGKVTFAAVKGAKMHIKPNVTIDAQEKMRINSTTHTFTGYSSHKNLEYFVELNGKTTKVEPKNFDDKTGEFTLDVTGFEQGNNYVEFSYKEKDADKPVVITKSAVKYNPLPILLWIFIFLGTLTLIAASSVGAFFAYKYMHTKKAHHKKTSETDK